ncbi:MAG: RluA family pseudouridine synthase [Thermodesulfovibrionia bacterium]|nr:RluA family pseudouridine synthase [Thermodesulfovibrionia bacterium]
MADYKVKTKSSLVDFLADIGYTKTKVKQLLKHRAIGVNGKDLKILSRLLLEGDTVSVSKDRKEKKEIKIVPSMGIKVIYEDDDLIVIEKPAGLLTIASDSEKIKTAYYQLNEFFKERTPGTNERLFIVHRLDRDTSGLIVFAKNETTKRALQGNWDQVDKRYYAIVEGAPVKERSEIRSRLSETKSLKVYSSRHSEDGKLAITKYRVIKKSPEYSLLEILLETGRKNQIRVHLSDIGHPVVGDKKYGARTNPFSRLGLHSYLLSFKHPATGALLRFESKLPGVFGKLT